MGLSPTAVTTKEAALVTTSPTQGFHNESAMPTPAATTAMTVPRVAAVMPATTSWPTKIRAASMCAPRFSVPGRRIHRGARASASTFSIVRMVRFWFTRHLLVYFDRSRRAGVSTRRGESLP